MFAYYALAHIRGRKVKGVDDGRSLCSLGGSQHALTMHSLRRAFDRSCRHRSAHPCQRRLFSSRPSLDLMVTIIGSPVIRLLCFPCFPDLIIDIAATDSKAKQSHIWRMPGSPRPAITRPRANDPAPYRMRVPRRFCARLSRYS